MLVGRVSRSIRSGSLSSRRLAPVDASVSRDTAPVRDRSKLWRVPSPAPMQRSRDPAAVDAPVGRLMIVGVLCPYTDACSNVPSVPYEGWVCEPRFVKRCVAPSALPTSRSKSPSSFTSARNGELLDPTSIPATGSLGAPSSVN
eukprot:2040516-Prymnesium_polylepis.1